MTLGIKVSASFNETGDISPLWIRIDHHEQSYVYKVKESTSTIPFNPMWVNSISYHCIVQQEGTKKERELNIEYNTRMHSWSAVVNNSLFSM